MTSSRWSVLALGVALFAAAVPPAAAHSAGSTALRDRMRCERTIEREGYRYAAHYSGELNLCVASLAECRTASGTLASYLCSRVTRMCEAMAASDREGARMKVRVLEACDDVPVARLMDDMGFGAQMADCAPTTHQAFADCLMAHVVASEGALAGQLRPSACQLLQGAGLGDDFPDVLCAPAPGGGACEPCDTCEPCEPGTPAGPAACGGPAELACGAGEACDRRDALCSNATVSGACVAVPGACANDGPVCGCDGQTYASDCARLQAGGVLAKAGACDPPPTSCRSNPECGPGRFCEYVFADCGEGQAGTCVPQRAAPCDLCSAWVDGPVCGCNGQTYASECERQAAGVSKLWFGPCF